MTGTALIPRASIYEIEAHRNRALDLFTQAFDLLSEACAAAGAAAPSGVFELPTLGFRDTPWTRDRESYVTRVRKHVDRGVWSHLIEACGFSTLMDKTAREQFRAQVAEDPPPATAENCESTLLQLAADAELIFKRGVATAFSSLDRRFRSHDGFKIGARVILSGMLTADGFWNHWRKHDETLVDVERAFYVMDRKSPPDRYGGIYGVVEEARRVGGLRAKAFTAEDDYFRVRVFANGNAHVWFKRADLVQRVNELLADYYGASLGASPDVARQHYSPEPGRAVAKNFGFWPSPAPVARRVMEAAGIHSQATVAARVLEPSAGRGALAQPAAEAGHEVTCVEVQPALAAGLSEDGHYRRVIAGDFLTLTPGALGLFDKIVMNPPFDRGLDVDHVLHALGFLSPGGVLVAVMSAGTEYREDRRTVTLRERVAALRGHFSDLPAGSFSDVGTNVNTILLTVRAP